MGQSAHTQTKTLVFDLSFFNPKNGGHGPESPAGGGGGAATILTLNKGVCSNERGLLRRETRLVVETAETASPINPRWPSSRTTLRTKRKFGPGLGLTSSL